MTNQINFAHSVGIGTNFFKKSLLDYSNWRWAMVRESAQNSIDCHSDNIWFTVKRDRDTTIFVFANDGVVMTRDELTGKLLTLGESGKDTGSAVGGFGAAKLCLYFAHKSYSITTGNLHVVGSGGSYTLTETDSSRKGTESIVLLEGDHVEELTSFLRSYVYMAQWKGIFHLNGQKLYGRFRKGHPRRTFSWGTVYTNRSFENRLIVRINGQPQFHRHLDCGGRCVLVEVEKRSTDVFTTNRDNLQYEQRYQLESLIDEITVDKMSALQERDLTTYRHYEGTKFDIKTVAEDLVDALEALDEDEEDSDSVEVRDDDDEPQEEVPDGVYAVDHSASLPRQGHVQTERPVKHAISIDFILKNTTGMETPMYFRPEGFSSYSKKLLDYWIKCVVATHKVFDRKSTFSVGFVLDQSNEAQYEQSGQYGEIFFINPAKVVKQNSSNSRSFSRRFSLTSVGKAKILADAIHEMVHAMGYGPHDERFAGKLTDALALVLIKRKEINKCISGISAQSVALGRT